MRIINKLPIYITEEDKSCLQVLIKDARSEQTQRDDLTALDTELNRASVVESDEIPRNVVTINSRVSIVNLDSSERMTLTLVFPEDADVDKNYISVLAPIGSGMLGYRTGDEFEWRVPSGKRRFKIVRVSYQPEAKGHHAL